MPVNFIGAELLTDGSLILAAAAAPRTSSQLQECSIIIASGVVFLLLRRLLLNSRLIGAEDKLKLSNLSRSEEKHERRTDRQTDGQADERKDKRSDWEGKNAEEPQTDRQRRKIRETER